MSSCSIKGCTNKNAPLFHIPAVDKANRYLSHARVSQWKKQCGLSGKSSSYRVCREHFFFKHPAELLDVNHPDWIPWLKLNPSKPLDHVYIQNRMQKYYELEKAVSNTLCIIKGCVNSIKTIDPNVRTFSFPTLETNNYVRRALSEKRLLVWMQIIDQRSIWESYDICKLKLCHLHFRSGIMADLTDVENVDWIPTVSFSDPPKFNDHIAYFDLYNLVSLVKDTKITDSTLTNRDLNFSFPKICQTLTLPQSEPKKNKTNIGLKCILCLSAAALKPLQPSHQSAIEILFKEILRVESELICSKCSKFVEEFFQFYESVIYSQENATTRKMKPIIPIPNSDPPTDSKPASIAPKKGTKLFEAYPSNEYRCTLCGVSLSGKKSLNEHLYNAHRVKISCKLCKNSFSPDGYTEHKADCIARMKKVQQSVAQVGLQKANKKNIASNKTDKSAAQQITKSAATKTDVVDIAAEKPQQKHSCYICMELKMTGWKGDAPCEHDMNDFPRRNRTVCIVPGCHERYGRGCSFHKFPKKEDKKRLKAWIVKLRLNFEPASTSRVCSSHFSIANFISPTTKRLTDRMILKSTAIPDINLPRPISDPTRDKSAMDRAERAARRSKQEDNPEDSQMSICTDTGEEKAVFKAPELGESFTPAEMQVHVKTHNTNKSSSAPFDENYQACKQCKKAIHKDNMEKHVQEHEEDRKRLKEMLQKQQQQTMNAHTCDICSHAFKSFALLEQHKKRHKVVSLDDKIECPDCNRVITAGYYKFHCRLVHDEVLFPCDKCGKQMSRASLKRHRQTTCGDDETVPCDICGKMMKSYLIKGHVSKVHASSGGKCSFCPKVFDSKDYALSHERWSHKEEWKQKRRTGVKQLELNRTQLEEALGIRTTGDSVEDNESCPVCLNVHGSATYVEAHMRAAHQKEYIAMIMGGVSICPTDVTIEDEFYEAMIEEDD